MENKSGYLLHGTVQDVSTFGWIRNKSLYPKLLNISIYFRASYTIRGITNEKKFESLEEKRKNAMEMAEKTNET